MTTFEPTGDALNDAIQATLESDDDVAEVATHFGGEEFLARWAIRALKAINFDANDLYGIYQHSHGGALGHANPYWPFLSTVNRQLQVILELTKGEPYVDNGDGFITWTDKAGAKHRAPKPKGGWPPVSG